MEPRQPPNTNTKISGALLAAQREDEMLSRINLLQRKVEARLTVWVEDFESKITKWSDGLASLKNQQSTLITTIQDTKIKSDKIDDFLPFQNNARNQILTHDIRISTIMSDVELMKDRYDKILSENWTVPGYIGDYSKFKTLREYIEHDVKIITKLKSYQEKTDNDFKKYQSKMEILIRQFNENLMSWNKQQNDYCNRNKNDWTEQMKLGNKEIREAIMEMRIENHKESKKLAEKAEMLANERENVIKSNNEIHLKFDTVTKEMKDDASLVRESFAKYKDDFTKMKKRFIELVSFIKDVRFRRNWVEFDGIKKNEVREWAQKIVFKKVRNYKQEDCEQEKEFDLNYDIYTGQRLKDGDDCNKTGWFSDGRNSNIRQIKYKKEEKKNYYDKDDKDIHSDHHWNYENVNKTSRNNNGDTGNVNDVDGNFKSGSINENEGRGDKGSRTVNNDNNYHNVNVLSNNYISQHNTNTNEYNSSSYNNGVCISKNNKNKNNTNNNNNSNANKNDKAIRNNNMNKVSTLSPVSKKLNTNHSTSNIYDQTDLNQCKQEASMISPEKRRECRTWTKNETKTQINVRIAKARVLTAMDKGINTYNTRELPHYAQRLNRNKKDDKENLSHSSSKIINSFRAQNEKVVTLQFGWALPANTPNSQAQSWYETNWLYGEDIYKDWNPIMLGKENKPQIMINEEKNLKWTNMILSKTMTNMKRLLNQSMERKKVKSSIECKESRNARSLSKE